MNLGNKILQRRKELGITQAELAEKMFVTRQTVSRWEFGNVYPDVQKVVELASILEVSCDYLLKDGAEQKTEKFSENISNESETEMEIQDDAIKGELVSVETTQKPHSAITRLLELLIGKQVKLTFYDDDDDWDLFDEACRVLSFHGNWIEVEFATKKEVKKKLIPISTILSIEILNEADSVR